MNKKIILFGFLFVFLSTGLVSAGLCMGYNGYYHECNSASYYYNKGYDVGYSRGYNHGFYDGYDYGHYTGYKKGYYVGFDDGKAYERNYNPYYMPKTYCKIGYRCYNYNKYYSVYPNAGYSRW